MKIFLSIFAAVLLFACSNNDDTKKNGEEKTLENNKAEFVQMGNQVSTLAQQELVKNVMKAITVGGTEYAVEYCNLNAVGITDSLSKALDCSISRISHKNRNPNNLPRTDSDTEALDFLEGGTDNIFLTEKDGKVYYYKTIKVGMTTCLACHGDTSKDIEPATFAKIQEKYPNDKAVNFKQNDFRGAWKIVFN